mgnify:CR=1 FL=1
MKSRRKSVFSIDPKIGLLILLSANAVLFMQKTAMPGNVFVLFLMAVFVICGCLRQAITFGLIFTALAAAQKFIFPVAPVWVNFLFGIFCNYTRRMLPCFMAGVLLIRTNTMHRFVLAMRSMHIPQSIIIPISVSVRYFPTMKEEFTHLSEAMRLRGMSAAEKVEGYIVPLMLSATNTAEELSQAAVTRGIENPSLKTSMEELKCTPADIVIAAFGIAIAVISIWADRFR